MFAPRKSVRGEGGGHNIGLGKAFNENELYSKHFEKLALNFSVE